MSTKATARVKVTLDIEVGGAWDGSCTTQQVWDQAGEVAVACILVDDK